MWSDRLSDHSVPPVAGYKVVIVLFTSLEKHIDALHRPTSSGSLCSCSLAHSCLALFRVHGRLVLPPSRVSQSVQGLRDRRHVSLRISHFCPRAVLGFCVGSCPSSSFSSCWKRPSGPLPILSVTSSSAVPCGLRSVLVAPPVGFPWWSMSLLCCCNRLFLARGSSAVAVIRQVC